jgi:hypothetical protein
MKAKAVKPVGDLPPRQRRLLVRTPHGNRINVVTIATTSGDLMAASCGRTTAALLLTSAPRRCNEDNCGQREDHNA